MVSLKKLIVPEYETCNCEDFKGYISDLFKINLCNTKTNTE